MFIYIFIYIYILTWKIFSRVLSQFLYFYISIFLPALHVDQTYFISNSYARFCITQIRRTSWLTEHLSSMETCGHMEFLPRGHDRELKKKKMGRLSMSWLTGIHVITSDDTFPHRTKVSRCAHRESIFLDESAALSRKANKGNDGA